MNDEPIKPTQNNVDVNKCALAVGQAGFCGNCGVNLIPMPANNQIMYIILTGEPYKEICFTCPTLVSHFTK